MEKKNLVAVFSASGVTRRVGQKIAETADGDSLEIVPEAIYTNDDLNWMNKRSRSSVEMSDPSARPAIRDRVENMQDYDIVIIGFPIWWGIAPRIIETFLESYDFSGKTIAPFCTSGGSGVGRSDTELHKNVSADVNWIKGVKINRPDETAIRRWLQDVL
ncbi:MAG: NAD(P)H-dependent oxidoreductase [Erysipelotrichaceae bacterium]|nr:NAD(P)H-dependent oxidoreductase [Erysipelotrichaceae bacterium]